MFSPLDKIELTQDQEDAIDNIITSMDLMDYEYVCDPLCRVVHK